MLAPLLPPVVQKPKIAFTFIARNRLALDMVWDAFFQDQFLVVSHQLDLLCFVKANTFCSKLLFHLESKLHFPKLEILQNGQRNFTFNMGAANALGVDREAASMLQAQRILPKNALVDPFNEQFVSLSDSCIPLYNFSYTYDYIMSSSTSFVDRIWNVWKLRIIIQDLLILVNVLDLGYNDKSPVPGLSRFSGQFCKLCDAYSNSAINLANAGISFVETKEDPYNPKMDPLIPVQNWRNGSQWVVPIRKHTGVVVKDDAVYTMFQLHCRTKEITTRVLAVPTLSKPTSFLSGHEVCQSYHGHYHTLMSRSEPADASKEHNCIPDEHYVLTLLAQEGLELELTRRSLTYSSWDLSSAKDPERRGWHPVTYRLSDATPLLIQSIKDIDNIYFETEYRREWCTSKGKPTHCFLFAGKFTRPAALRLLNMFLGSTTSRS
ncbi:Glycosyl transferase, family 14 [Dillenia turbinata]|uniref:Glycosyl transferase, family 14 n=1 Tax=Dillenia turbinata TaxID=194707 RepID=A0AAN8UCX1_9MAGN